VSLQQVHDFELRLLDPCLAMSKRGIRIDDKLRRQRIKEIARSIKPLANAVQAAVLPLLNDDIPKAHLFREKWTCPCCKNGSKLKRLCWRCLGKLDGPNFTKAPTKRELALLHSTFDVPLGQEFEYPCQVCSGEGQRITKRFKLSSHDQMKIVLYDLLKLPKRMAGKKLRTDESALKELLPFDKSGIVKKLLAVGKASTMLKIYRRLEPAEDGRVHTFYNPAGTETGRFSSRGGEPYPKKASDSFALIKSTNLQNMPKKEARDGQYNVRELFLPDEGQVLVEADLSQAEARVVAALANDTALLERWTDPAFDVHTWTAAHIYNKDPTDVTKSERFLGKVARHALNYGMGWKTFLANVNADADTTGVSITAAEAKRIVAAYHRLHPSLESWWRRVGDHLDSHGWISTVYHRRRTFFGRRRGDKRLDEVHKEAIAFEPQSTVADLLNHGLLVWWDNYEGKIGQLLMQVHDSIVTQVPRGREKLAAKLLKACLEQPLQIGGTTLVIPADVEAGLNWAKMEKL